LSDPRQRQLVKLLRDRPFASVRELQERLGASAATVRRDTDRIDEPGEDRKVYGGVSGFNGAARVSIAYAKLYNENCDVAVDAGDMARVALAAGAVQ